MGKKTGRNAKCKEAPKQTDFIWTVSQLDNLIAVLETVIKMVVLFWIVLFSFVIAIWAMKNDTLLNNSVLTVKQMVFDIPKAAYQIGNYIPNKEGPLSVEKFSWENSKDLFLQQLESLSKEFPSQKRETWRQLRATIGKTLKPEEPESPAVIMALIPPQVAPQFATCFLRQLSSLLNKAILTTKSLNSGPLTLTPSTFKDLSITQIHDIFDYYMNSEGKTLLVVDVDKFEEESHLLILHGICDNYKAVDTRATVLFLVQVPHEIYNGYSDWNHYSGMAIAQDVLATAWKDKVGSNVGPPLIARVADAVILLENGDECREKQEHQSRYFEDIKKVT